MKFNYWLISIVLFATKVESSEDFKSPLESPRYRNVTDGIYAKIDVFNITHGSKLETSLAKLGQFPYQVFIETVTANGAFFCSGTLIDNRWVLTSANCLDGVTQLEIFFGAINRFLDGREGSYLKKMVVKNVSSLFKHPLFNETTFANDIGLIELPEDAEIDGCLIGKVKLPKKGSSCHLKNQTAIVSGFGKLSGANSSLSTELHFAERSIVMIEICMLIIGSPPINDEHICVDAATKDSLCITDSGGPLLITGDDGKPLQVGVASFIAIRDCILGYPDGFTCIAIYISWIEEVTGLCLSL